MAANGKGEELQEKNRKLPHASFLGDVVEEEPLPSE
jgi:hypothetical protein